MMKKLALAIFLLVCSASSPWAACMPNTNPGFTSGGTVFGRLALQWNAYFGAKVDVTGGCSDTQNLNNPTINGVPVPGAPIASVVAPLNLSAGGALSLAINSTLQVSGGNLGIATPVGVANGGTGTGTAFTTGSIVFAGTGGTYSQDNADLFWDDTNNRLGIRTATPLFTLDVAGDINAQVKYDLQGVAFATVTSGYPTLVDAAGGSAILLPKSADKEMYFAADTHKFRNWSQTVPFMDVSAGALTLYGTTSGTLSLAVPSTATGGTLRFPNGSTNFVVTGPGVVQQASAGAAFTVAPVAYTEVSGNISQYSGVNNCAIIEAHASNNVTFTLVGADGNPLSASNVCTITGGGALNGGLPQQTTITAPLSVTLNSGSTLGIGNNVPFRVWFLEATDGTTTQLVVFVAANPGSPTAGIVSIGPGATVACNACATATSIQTYYGPTATAGATLHRTIGYANYSSGLPTAGQWSASPSSIALMTPGTPTPGQPVGRTAYATNSSTTTTGSATPVATGLTCTLNMTASMNFARVEAHGDITVSTAVGVITSVQLSRGISPTLVGNVARVDSGASGTAMEVPASLFVLDAPQSSGSVSYTPYLFGSGTSANAFQWNSGGVVTNCQALEIQG